MWTRQARARPGRTRRPALRPHPRSVALALTASAVVWWSQAAACGATNWSAPVASGSKGESQSKALPAAPGGVGAACAAPTTSKTVKVTWSAVSLATGYPVYDSTTSATGSYTLVASGVTGTAWTSGTLTNNTNYWFEVTALIAANWASVTSAASPESTIKPQSPLCVQP